MSCPEQTVGATEDSRGKGVTRAAFQLVALGLLLGGCAESWPEPPEDLQAEAIVVLGNRPPTDEHGRVMPETERRVRRGVELFQRGHAPVLLMTGGPAPGGDIEAEVMRAYAVELGVPEEAIRIETKSENTIENAHFSKRILSGEEDGEDSPHVVLVTSPSHLGRAQALFECAGFDVDPAAF